MKQSIILKELSAGYNGKSILKDISCTIPSGTIHVVIGPSGAGKTTFLKLINGILSPKKGSLSVLQGNISKKDIGYIPQHLGLVGSKTVLENVLLGSLSRVNTFSSLFKKFPEKEISFAHHLLSIVGLDHKSNQQVNELSGGEKRRVAIARAFMQKPKILLADEILSDLDFVLVNDITKQIKKLKEEFGVTVVMVEHDLKIAKAIGDTIMMMREGENRGVYSSKQVTDKFLYKAFT